MFYFDLSRRLPFWLMIVSDILLGLVGGLAFGFLLVCFSAMSFIDVLLVVAFSLLIGWCCL